MRYFWIILLVTINIKTHGQNILDFFINVPDSVCILNKIDRTKMIDRYKKGVNEYFDSDENKYWFDIVDLKNGYLRFSGAFEGTWEICYWIKTNKQKMIGISNISCGPVCGSKIIFYDYIENKLIPLNTDSILPKVENRDYYDIPKIQNNNSPADFIKLQKEFRVAWTYRLPQKGLNMSINFEEIDEIDNQKYKIYYKGDTDKMELIWNDGHFIKGKYVK
jgi:hypothetical protein